MITYEELKERQNLSLKDKIDFSIEKIEKWYDYWGGKVYVAFSGGKDSTVLLHLVRSVFPEVPAVFSDTGLMFPEEKEFVKTFDNLTIVRPKYSFKQVIEKYGYPVVSKEQSEFIHEVRHSKSEKLRDIRLNGNKWGYGKIFKKWRYLIDAPFEISDKCCDVLKKNPILVYEKNTQTKPFLGMLAEESDMRTTTYMRNGCNLYDGKRPVSTPIAFWKEEDIWNYIKERELPYCNIYDKGYDRTGCLFCLYGIQKDGTPNRIQKLKETHPKLYNYCLEELKIKDVLTYMDIPYE